METYKLNGQSGQLLVLYSSSTQIGIAIEKMVYIKLREAKYSSSIVLASNGPFPTKWVALGLEVEAVELGGYPGTAYSTGLITC